VLIEAVTSGTPVLASRIDGNRGMLGDDYAGYFDWNDAAALAGLLATCRATQPSPQGLLQRLARQAHSRAPRFAADAERAATRRLVGELLRQRGPRVRCARP
jgi:glycosyltransferase involved in cell wall biosynthesis